MGMSTVTTKTTAGSLLIEVDEAKMVQAARISTYTNYTALALKAKLPRSIYLVPQEIKVDEVII